MEGEGRDWEGREGWGSEDDVGKEEWRKMSPFRKYMHQSESKNILTMGIKINVGAKELRGRESVWRRKSFLKMINVDRKPIL